MSICTQCINRLFTVTENDGNIIRCIFHDCPIATVTECNHLKAKPKQDNTINEAKKSLKEKGQNIPKVTILDNNPLSIASYMEEHPDVDL